MYHGKDDFSFYGVKNLPLWSLVQVSYETYMSTMNP